jgi:hypothetical protein
MVNTGKTVRILHGIRKFCVEYQNQLRNIEILCGISRLRPEYRRAVQSRRFAARNTRDWRSHADFWRSSIDRWRSHSVLWRSPMEF